MAGKPPQKRAATKPSRALHTRKPAPAAAKNATRRPTKAPTRIDNPETQVAAISPQLDAQPAGDLADKPLPPFMTVAIGASAGGLEAISQLLQSTPEGLGMAFIVVQHLSPQHPSFLPELLSAQSRMPVVQVTEDMRIEPDRVHVIPPNAHMQVVAGHLHLVPRPEDRTQHMPVDAFFTSLAQYAQNRAIGIILSGTASDGAIGIQEIKAAGGITIAQQPRSAKTDGMPRAAIATGVVDLVLTPQEIARELERISHHPLLQPPALHDEAGQLTPDENLARIFMMLRNVSGVDFTHYKLPTIRRRLHRRMVLHRVNTLDDYAKFLHQNPPEVKALYQDLLIHVTRFFREPDSFKALASTAFPAIIQSRAPDQPIRVWVPGCSTGEEAYSVAIALVEFLAKSAFDAPVQIFATDVSEAAIEHARASVYPESITADVPAELLRRFFTKVDGAYKMNKSVRDLCIFARQDLTHDPPFSRLDLIVCRNVLIYLGPAFQKRLMGVFHYALKPTGFLMLGSAETVGTAADLFTILDKRHKLYARKNSVSRADMTFPSADYARPSPERGHKLIAESRPPAVQNEANQVILSRYSPAAVIVDDDFQIVQFRGQTGRFLEPAPGEPNLNLLKMAREGLLYALRTALQEARNTHEPVRREGLRIRADRQTVDVNIEVIPLRSPTGNGHYLVLFEDVTARLDPADRARKKAKPGSKPPARRAESSGESRSLRELRKELAASREYLQTIIQDLEAANEELQSANEEILSANEELQSTNEELDTAKEELQSTNEELNTVNEELQGRNEELSRVNSDLVNLIGSVQIAIVMVTSDLRIRRFTPMAEKILNLIPSDIGRPIGDIKPNIDCPDLESFIARVIDTVTILERQVQDRSGAWYSLRIRPYKSVENRIDGAVLVLFESQDSDLHAEREQAERGRQQTEALMQIASCPLVMLDPAGRILAANEAFCRASAAPAEQARGERLFDLAGGRWGAPALRQLVSDLLADRRPAGQCTVELPGSDGRSILVNGRRISGNSMLPALVLLAFGLEVPEPGRTHEQQG